MAWTSSYTVHRAEEARSRFLSPISFTSLTTNKLNVYPQIFNRLKLLPQFGFAVNLPESTTQGRRTTKGRMEYLFKMFGSTAVLFI